MADSSNPFEDLIPPSNGAPIQSQNPFEDLIPKTPTQPTGATANPFEDLVPAQSGASGSWDNPDYPTSPLSNGVHAGALELKGLYGDIIPAMWDKVTGDPEAQKRQLQEYQSKQQEIQDVYPAPFRDVQEAWAKDPTVMGRISNEWEQAKYNIMSGLVSNVPAVAATVLSAGALGPAVVGADAAISDAADTLLTTYAKRYGEAVVKSGVAGAAASEPQMVASSYVDRLQETGIDSPTTAVVAGTLANSLQTLPFIRIAAARIPKPLQQAVTNEVAKIALERLTLKSLLPGMLGSAATGAATTAAGTLVNQMATKIVDDAPYDVFSKANVDRLIDSGVSGGTAMGAIHAMTALPGAFKGSYNKYSPESDYTNSDVEKNSRPVVDPTQALPSPEGSPEQPLPTRPMRSQFKNQDGSTNEEAYGNARSTYENYFKDRFNKGPEEYYKDRAQDLPDEGEKLTKGEIPEESASALKDVLPKGTDISGVTPDFTSPESIAVRKELAENDAKLKVDHTKHVLPVDLTLDLAKNAGNYPATLEGSHQIAKDYLLDMQDKTGHEHNVLIDKTTGRIVEAHTDNNENQTSIGGIRGKALAKDPSQQLSYLHNHPGEPSGAVAPLSVNDTRALLFYRGIHDLGAVGANGEYSSASMTSLGHVLKDMTEESGTPHKSSMYTRIINYAHAKAKDIMVSNNGLRSKENYQDYVKNYPFAHTEAANRALADVGLIQYASNHASEGRNAQEVSKLQAPLKESLETYINRNFKQQWKEANERAKQLRPSYDRLTDSGLPTGEAGKIHGINENPATGSSRRTGSDAGSEVNPPVEGGEQPPVAEPQPEIAGEAKPFDPNSVQRNIVNAEPNDNLKANNFAIPKALDRITQEVTGNKDFNQFQTLGQDHTTLTPEAKTNLFNSMRTGLDLVRGAAKDMFTHNTTPLTEFFHHAVAEDSPYLKPSDRVLLENSIPQVRKQIASKLGIDPRDLITNYPDAAIQAQAFHEFMNNRYNGKPPESYGSATSVFNKLGNILYRQGQVLNANKLSGVDSFASGIKKEQLNDALYALAENRNKAWEGSRVGATVEAARNTVQTDKDYTDHAKNDKPEDIRHLNKFDNTLGTAMFMASKYPWMSDVIQHFNGKLDRVAQISKQIGTIPRDMLSRNKNNFNMIHEILDSGRMNDTQAKIEGPVGNRVLRFKWRDGSTRVIEDQHLIDQFEATRNNYKSTIDEDEGDFRKYLNQNYGLPESASTKDVSDFADRLQSQRDLAGSKDPMYRKITDQIKELNDIGAALKNIRSMKNTDYVPHIRSGKRAVMVFKKGSDGAEDSLVYLAGLEESSKGKLNPTQEQIMRQEIEKYKNSPAHYILGDKPNNGMRLTQSDVLKRIPPQHVSAELIYSLFGDGSKESADALQEMIQGKINNSKLAFYLKPSSNIEGYSKDWPRTLETWVHARSLNQSNKETDAHLSKVLTYVEDLEKNGNYHPYDVKYLKDFVNYNRDRTADMMRLRTMNFLVAMGGRMKTAIMQLFNGPQLMVPALTQGGGNFMRLQGSWAKNLGKASQILNKTWFNKGQSINLPELWQEVQKQGILTPDQFELAKKFSSSHLMDQTILDDNAGTSYESRDLSGQALKQVQLTAHLLGAHIGEAEKMARLASILTTAKELSDPETFRRLQNAYADDPGWQAYKNETTGRLKGAYTEKEAMAFYLMEKAHGRYGKSGRGRIQRGMAASVFFPFSTQMLIQWEHMKDSAMRKGPAGKLAAMYTLGSFMALGGLSALPGYATTRALYNTYDALKEALPADTPTPARDFDIDLRRWLGNAVGEDWANTIQKGPARHLLGVDISNTTTLPTSAETIASKPLDVMAGILRGKSPDLTQMVGPALSPINTTAASLKAGSALPLLPPTARDLYAGFKGMQPSNPQGGIKTQQGTQIQPLIDPKTGLQNYSTKDRVAKTLGFTPTQESEQRQSFYEEKWTDEANKGKASDLVQKATEVRVNMLQAIKDGKPESLIDAYRNKVNDIRQSWINFQKQAKTPNINVDNFNNAIIKGSLEQQQGWQPRTLKGRQQEDQIKNRNIYGYQSKQEQEDQASESNPFEDLIPKGGKQ